MANWMMTGLSKEQVAAARVKVTRHGRLKLKPCGNAVSLWRGICHQTGKPIEVVEDNIRRFQKYDIASWLANIYESLSVGAWGNGETLRGYQGFTRARDSMVNLCDDRFRVEAGTHPHFSDDKIKELTIYTKAAIIAAKRYYDNAQ